MYRGSIMATLLVRDVVGSVAYYRDVLGFDFRGYWDDKTGSVVERWERSEQPGYAEVYVGEARLGLRPDADAPPPSGVALGLATDDIDALYARLRERGAAPSEPAQQPWGAKLMTLRDPNGLVWSFLG